MWCVLGAGACWVGPQLVRHYSGPLWLAPAFVGFAMCWVRGAAVGAVAQPRSARPPQLRNDLTDGLASVINTALLIVMLGLLDRSRLVARGREPGACAPSTAPPCWWWRRRCAACCRCCCRRSSRRPASARRWCSPGEPARAAAGLLPRGLVGRGGVRGDAAAGLHAGRAGLLARLGLAGHHLRHRLQLCAGDGAQLRLPQRLLAAHVLQGAHRARLPRRGQCAAPGRQPDRPGVGAGAAAGAGGRGRCARRHLAAATTRRTCTAGRCTWPTSASTRRTTPSRSSSTATAAACRSPSARRAGCRPAAPAGRRRMATARSRSARGPRSRAPPSRPASAA